MRSDSTVDVLMVGPIPPDQNYIGGIGTLLRAQLNSWELPASVALLNTELFQREFGTTGKFRLKNFLTFLINAVRLTLAIWQRDPVLVHFHSSTRLGLLKDGILAFWARWICQRKVILHIHNAIAEVILLPLPVFWQRLELRFLMASCDRMVFLSRTVVSDLTRKLSANETTRLYAKAAFLVNFTEFTELPDRRPHLRASGAPVNVFFIGNIGQQKGAYDLLLAAQQVALRCVIPFRVVFAGPFDSQEDAERMSALVSEIGLADYIQFLGPVTGPAKVEAFRDADIFALPSYGEGVPVALLEAMAFGLPIVATNVGGIPETVTDGKDGFLFPPGEVETLTANLVRLIESPQLRLEIGRAAQARAVKCHTVHAYFVALSQLYSTVGLKPLCAVGS